MVIMRFHYLNEDEEKERSVKISAPTVEECIEIANDEIEGTGFIITDYYII